MISTLGPEPYSYPPFQSGFFPWENEDSSFLLNDPISPPELIISSNSGSDTPSPGPISPNSGSDEPDPKRKQTENIKHGSGSTPNDERKHRRMVSNRESARRSRMRKQRHLEDLVNRLNQLRTGNRELVNRIQVLVHQNLYIRTENENLVSETTALRQRLWDIRQVLLVRQLQQHLNPRNNVAGIINEGLSLLNNSLIT